MITPKASREEQNQHEQSALWGAGSMQEQQRQAWHKISFQGQPA